MCGWPAPRSRSRCRSAARRRRPAPRRPARDAAIAASASGASATPAPSRATATSSSSVTGPTRRSHARTTLACRTSRLVPAVKVAARARCRDHPARAAPRCSRSRRSPTRWPSPGEVVDRRRRGRDQPGRPAAARRPLPAAAGRVALPRHGVLGPHRRAGRGRHRLAGRRRGLRAAGRRRLRREGRRAGRAADAAPVHRVAGRRGRAARGHLHGALDGVRRRPAAAGRVDPDPRRDERHRHDGDPAGAPVRRARVHHRRAPTARSTSAASSAPTSRSTTATTTSTT